MCVFCWSDGDFERHVDSVLRDKSWTSWKFTAHKAYSLRNITSDCHHSPKIDVETLEMPTFHLLFTRF